MGPSGPRLVAANTAGELSRAARVTGIRASLEESLEGERDSRVIDAAAFEDAGKHFRPDEMDMRSSLNICTL